MVIQDLVNCEPQTRLRLTDSVIKLAVLSYVYEAILSERILTKRDLYYRDVELFRSQDVVDNVLNQLTEHLGAQRLVANFNLSSPSD